MNLQEWRKLSFQLSADLQTLHIEARRHGLAALAEEAAALRARVEDRRFTVAVVGDFRRGKSTFINALLGRSILPSDVAPTTATVNRVVYGSKPSAELRFWDDRPSEHIPIEALAAHVTKLSADSLARSAAIREAVVTWPVRFCRNDVDILDTPGLGDEATMTAVTMRQLPSADAAILVIMADSPFSETEGEFLDRLYAEGVNELLFVVSAIDRIRRPPDRERVLASIRDRIAARVRRAADARFAPGSPEHAAFLARRGSPRVFGVSALTALEARESDDVNAAPAIEGSGMPAFEHALEEFLTGADEVGLRRRLEQAEALCRQFAPREAPVAEAAPAELTRLGALVRAVESALQSQQRRVGDACARAVVAMKEPTERLGPRAVVLFNNDLQLDIRPYWPARFPDYAHEVANKLVLSVRQAIALLTPDIQKRLDDELAAVSAEEARLVRVAEYVLGFVASRLTALGYSTAPAPVAPGAVNAAFDTEALMAALTPPAAAFQQALEDPALVSTLQAASKRSAFDALLAFDFTGLQGRFAAQALPRVGGVLDGHWQARRPTEVVQELVDRVARARLAALEPLARAVRAASSDLVAARERAGIAREQRAREVATSARTIQEIAERLHATAGRLGG